MKLPIPLSEPPYKKENSWIVWLENEKHEICDIEIYETFPQQPGRVCRYIELKLNGQHFCDIGNCLSDWDKWKLQDIFHLFGFQKEFINRNVKLKFFEKLANIEEFSETIKGYSLYHDPMFI